MVKKRSPAVRAHFRTLLKAWFELMERYVRATDGDLPYRYGERATLSLLAGSVWALGGHDNVAIEEYSTRRGTWKRGRADAWWLCKGAAVAVEAKQDRPSGRQLADGNAWVRRVRNKLAAAKKQARSLRAFDNVADFRAAIVFVCPRLHDDDDTTSVLERLRRRLEEVFKRHDGVNLVALWEVPWSPRDEDARSWPAIGLVGYVFDAEGGRQR